MHSIDSSSVSIQATYTSNLTATSSKYTRDCIQPNYYYEAIEINVAENGYYTLVSDSNMDTYGYLYENNFNPFNPFVNQIMEDDESGCNRQFKLYYYLQKQKTYILIITTSDPNVTGSFSIIALGLSHVTLKRSGEYTYHVH